MASARLVVHVGGGHSPRLGVQFPGSNDSVNILWLESGVSWMLPGMISQQAGLDHRLPSGLVLRAGHGLNPLKEVVTQPRNVPGLTLRPHHLVGLPWPGLTIREDTGVTALEGVLKNIFSETVKYNVLGLAGEVRIFRIERVGAVIVGEWLRLFPGGLLVSRGCRRLEDGPVVLHVKHTGGAQLRRRAAIVGHKVRAGPGEVRRAAHLVTGASGEVRHELGLRGVGPVIHQVRGAQRVARLQVRCSRWRLQDCSRCSRRSGCLTDCVCCCKVMGSPQLGSLCCWDCCCCMKPPGGCCCWPRVCCCCCGGGADADC